MLSYLSRLLLFLFTEEATVAYPLPEIAWHYPTTQTLPPVVSDSGVEIQVEKASYLLYLSHLLKRTITKWGLSAPPCKY